MTAHDFSWTKTYDLSIDQAESYRLIKGVAMSEGEMKRGELMNEDNLRYATGALAASAVLGFAVCDVDHWPEGIPSQKELSELGAEGYDYSKYDIAKINEVYPCCYIIDAELVQNKAGVDGAPKWQVEFIASCENEEVYKMIKANKFKGNSVVDFPREYSCDKCNAETGKCTCDVKGSKFMLNTLILEAVPNSNATWVAAINKNDIGGILKPHSNSKKNSQWLEDKIKLFKKNILNSTETKQTNKKENAKKTKNEFEPSDVDSYQTDGKWTDGVESVQAFLENEKGIASEEAQQIAKIIFENPSLLNKDQLEALSGDDIVEWFRHLQTIDRKHFHKFIHEIKSALSDFTKVTHSTLLTQEDAVYRESEDENACASCRWSNFSDDPVTDESEGTCQLVEGTITAPAVCDRHEPIPGEEPEDDGEETEEDPADESEEESKNDSETETESIDTVTEDTVTDDTEETEDLTALEKAANTAPKKHSKPKRTISLSGKKQPSNHSIDARISALEKERTDLGFIVGNTRESMKTQSRYDTLSRQIKNLKIDKLKLPTNGLDELNRQINELSAKDSTPKIKAEIERLENLKKKY